MAQYLLTSPKGEKFRVTAPDDASQDEVFEFFQSSLPKDTNNIVPRGTLTEDAKLTRQVEARSGPQLIQGTEKLIENLPAIAATAGSLAVPQMALPAAAAKLGPVAAPFIRGIPKILSAAAGGGTGGMIRKDLQDPNASLSEIGQEGLTEAGKMAGAETAGIGIASLIGKALSPISKAMTSRGEELSALSKEMKVPLSPSALQPSALTKIAEGGSDLFLPSKLVNDHYRKAAVIRFNQLASEIPQEVGQLKGNQQIADEALEAFRNVFTKKEMQAKQLSKDFLESIGPAVDVELTKTLATLKNIKESAVDERLLSFVDKKLSAIGKSSQYRADSLETMLRQISGIKPKGDSKFLEQLRNAIKSDFAEAGADVTKLAEGNQLFKENIGLLAGKTAKELKAASQKGFTPQALTVKIFRNGNEGFVKDLGKELPKEIWDNLRAQNLANMIENASTESQRLMGMRIIDGAKLEKILDSNKSVMNVAYRDKEDVMEGMYNLAKLAKAAKPDLAKLDKGIADPLMTGNLALGGLVGYSDPVSLVVVGGTSMLIAKSMMNPNGLMKRWLTTGFKTPAAVNEGIKLGGRSVFQSGGDERNLPARQ